MATIQTIKPFKGEFLCQVAGECVELIEAQVQERVGGYLDARGIANDSVMELVRRVALDTNYLSVALWRIDRAVRELDNLLNDGISTEILTERLNVALGSSEFNREVELFLGCVSKLLL